jgi:N6-L-threonylcarbamoyladenine synthase
MNKILAIDTSCDDSSAAIVDGQTVLSNVVASQNQIHKEFGGVFPTLAKQAHKENLEPAIHLAIKNAQIDWTKIDAIAITVGPGLAPALEVGINKTKELALKYNKKIIAINHIEAHALSPLAISKKLKNNEKKTNPTIKLPSLAVVISGGHSEFILIDKIGHYQKIGKTIDDAAGECLDKVGRLLNLGYPAGPLMEKFAKKGRAGKFIFPKAMTSHDNFDLSFSGLKTSARNLIENLEKKNKLDKQTIYDLALALQETVFEQITYKLERILLSPNLMNREYPKRDFLRHLKKGQAPLTEINEIWLGGGVSANISLRKAIRKLLSKYYKLSGKKIELKVPYSKKLCGDNAAMIGLVAGFKYSRGEFANAKDLDRKPNFEI